MRGRSPLTAVAVYAALQTGLELANQAYSNVGDIRVEHCLHCSPSGQSRRLHLVRKSPRHTRNGRKSQSCLPCDCQVCKLQTGAEDRRLSESGLCSRRHAAGRPQVFQGGIGVVHRCGPEGRGFRFPGGSIGRKIFTTPPGLIAGLGYT